jgi:hypothetical protein
VDFLKPIESRLDYNFVGGTMSMTFRALKFNAKPELNLPFYYGVDGRKRVQDLRLELGSNHLVEVPQEIENEVCKELLLPAWPQGKCVRTFEDYTDSLFVFREQSRAFNPRFPNQFLAQSLLSTGQSLGADEEKINDFFKDHYCHLIQTAMHLAAQHADLSCVIDHVDAARIFAGVLGIRHTVAAQEQIYAVASAREERFLRENAY